MAKKKSEQKNGKENKNRTKKIHCGLQTPGPKYVLKTLVGYHGHCYSKFRNPAYTFGYRQTSSNLCKTPGPTYLEPPGKGKGFTFGYAATGNSIPCTPGPYLIQEKPPPGFSIRSRTDYRCGNPTPGPYFIQCKTPGPAFTIGRRPFGLKCNEVPGPKAPIDINIIKLQAPKFTIGLRQTDTIACKNPGPSYLPTDEHGPKYSFGVKHSECAPPYITACDEKC